MKTKEAHREELEIKNKPIPKKISDSDILVQLRKEDIAWDDIVNIKKLSNSTDKVLSEWLNINIKTLRTYKQTTNPIKENIKEHILLLLNFSKIGNEVFGSKEDFDKWLNTPNYFFDNSKPGSFLNTITGIRFVTDRLTAMDFGDNV